MFHLKHNLIQFRNKNVMICSI